LDGHGGSIGAGRAPVNRIRGTGATFGGANREILLLKLQELGAIFAI
jgi:hypothetical protein